MITKADSRTAFSYDAPLYIFHEVFLSSQMVFGILSMELKETRMLQDIIGTAAAVLTTSSFLPQAVKTVRTRDTHSISLGMYILFSCGVILWLVYGIAIRQWPIIVANAITSVLSITILLFKITEGGPGRHTSQEK
jgi:MtN3 and saliva related transmembrane protein